MADELTGDATGEKFQVDATANAVGSGASAEVFPVRGRDDVLLKVYTGTLGLDTPESVRGAFRAQRRDAAQLDRVGVAYILDTAGPQRFLIKKTPGVDLDVWVRGAALDPPSVETLLNVALAFTELIARLEATKDPHTVHYDIKPPNVRVLVTRVLRAGTVEVRHEVSGVWLTDNDSALQVSYRNESGRMVSPSPNDLVAQGTPGFLRREFFSERTKTMGQDDQSFATAVTLAWVLLGGVHPTATLDPARAGRTAQDLIREGHYPRWTDPEYAPAYWPLAAAISSALDDLLERGLRASANKRPRASEYADALRESLGIAPRPVVKTKPPPARRLLAPLLALLGFGAARAGRALAGGAGAARKNSLLPLLFLGSLAALTAPDWWPHVARSGGQAEPPAPPLAATAAAEIEPAAFVGPPLPPPRPPPSPTARAPLIYRKGALD